MNINNAVDKAYEDKSLTELADAPIAALQGISERQAKLLQEAFRIRTIRQLANLKYIRRAQAIVALAATEED